MTRQEIRDEILNLTFYASGAKRTLEDIEADLRILEDERATERAEELSAIIRKLEAWINSDDLPEYEDLHPCRPIEI